MSGRRGLEGAGRLVLVVDDDDIVRRVVRAMLEADDFEVLEARDGDEALERVASDHPMVVVLDVMMPGLDGIEVCRRVQHGTRVLMLTARDDAETEAASREAGARGFIAKPFSSVDLLDRIEELVGPREQAASG